MKKEQLEIILKTAHDVGLGITALRVLLILKDGGSQKLTYLATMTGVTPAAMTGAADRLVRMGFVARTLDDNDRRVILLSITPEGASTVDGIFKANT
jgi:DNA-binding MarR family transcriptional regulator